MIVRSYQLLLLVWVSCSLAQAGVTVKGVTSDCFAGKPFRPKGVQVYIFDAAKSPRMAALLKTMDSSIPSNDQESIGRFAKRYAELIRLVKASAPLARTRVDHNGSFETVISGVENVIVFGYAELEDEPFYYAYTQVSISGRSTISITLDFARHDPCTR